MGTDLSTQVEYGKNNTYPNCVDWTVKAQKEITTAVKDT